MAKITVTVRRTPSWQCIVNRIGRIPHPQKEALERFIATDIMAELPDGSPACLLCACRVVDVDQPQARVFVDAQVATPVWGAGLDMYLETIVQPAVARAFVALCHAQLVPIDGSELEVLAFYPKDVVVDHEVFAKNHGVVVTMSHDYLARVRRTDAQAAARAQRAWQTETLRVEHVEREATWVVRQWRALGRFLGAWGSVNYPPPPPPRTGLPEDVWLVHQDRVMDTVLASCEKELGSLLRRSTVYHDEIAAHLGGQGVAVGESATMQAFREEQVRVQRKTLWPLRGSVLLQPVEGAEVPEAATLLRDYASHEVVLSFPRKPR